MKRRINIFLYLTLLLGYSNCKKNANDVIGIYASRNNINTIDSLWITDNAIYINKVYRKSDSSLVYKNTGKWRAENGYVIFDNFFTEEDEVHSKEVINYENVLITTKLEIEERYDKTIFHHKSMYDNIYLEKID